MARGLGHYRSLLSSIRRMSAETLTPFARKKRVRRKRGK